MYSRLACQWEKTDLAANQCRLLDKIETSTLGKQKVNAVTKGKCGVNAVYEIQQLKREVVCQI